MYCDSALQKAYHMTCCICNKGIYYGNYEMIKNKAHKSKTRNFPAKTIYVHTECYNQEYEQHRPLYDPHRRVPPPSICK